MKRTFSWTAAISGTLLAFAAGAAEMTALPEGPNRDVVSKVCQGCHDLQMVFDAAGISHDEWDMSLEEMTANGMNISADDRAKILAYLSTYLGPMPPKSTAH
jgi:cytochrome c5